MPFRFVIAVLATLAPALAFPVSPPGLAASGPASGPGQPAQPARTAWPADAEAIIVLENASRLGETPAGEGLVRAALETAFFARTSRAWAALSERLGWSPEKAFDELLGRRSTLIMTGLDAKGDPDWVLLCEVTRETQARFRSRMELAPRDIQHDSRIAALEEGKFKLGIAGRGHGPFTFILAPAEHAELFDKVVETKRPTDLPEAGGAATLTVTYRPRMPDGGRGTLMLRAVSAPDQTHWDVEFTSTPDIFRLPDPPQALPGEWATSWVSCETCEASAVSVVGAGPEVLGGMGEFLVGLFGLSGGPGGREAGFEGGSAEARRFASMRLVEIGGRLEPELTVALEAPAHGAARRADEHMGEFVERITGRPGPAFDGSLPGVPRVAPVRSPVIRSGGEAGRGAAQSLIWTTREMGGSALWFVRLSPRGSEPEAIREFRELVDGFARSGGERDTERNLVSAGAIRPDALVRWARQIDPSDALGPLSWFPLVTWRATLHDGQVIGRAQVHVRREP